MRSRRQTRSDYSNYINGKVSAVLMLLVIGFVVFAYLSSAPKADAESAAPLSVLRKAAVRTSKAVTKVLKRRSKISAGDVYRIKSGTKLSRSRIKKTGGSGRYFRIYKIKKGDAVYKRIAGRSYRENPNIGLSDLRYIKTLYYDFDGNIRSGEIIVNKTIAADIKDIFAELYDTKYQIRKMRLVDDYWESGGSATAADTRSMNDDNTSGFNYRTVAGTSTISTHGYGRAIDVNPFENPWCPGGKLYSNQQASRDYVNRSAAKPHMIFAASDITKIFKKHGFRWLGETATRDYQHFEK